LRRSSDLTRANARFVFAIAASPDGKWRSPEPGSRQIPVDQILQPVAEPACTRGLRFPVYGLIEGNHLVLKGCSPDKPRVERIIQHRFIRAPAVRVGVFVLLYLKCLVFLLENYRDDYIRRLVVRVTLIFRSEERRVGKECHARRRADGW